MQKVIDLIKDDLAEVKKIIANQLTSDVYLINEVGKYLINSGGKHIRPIITLLCAKAIGYKGSHHLMIAAFIEFIHTATLLHDDVIDESELRRGNKTANNIYGNAASVLVGDYIYTRAFQMMVSLGSISLLDEMSRVTNIIVEGEVQQLLNINDTQITKEQYFDVIYSKTAKLFEASAFMPTLLIENSDEIKEALKNYGTYLGTAFQIIDDLLDYSGDNVASLGKNLGDDLAEGKLTLPLIHLLDVLPDKEISKNIKDSIINGESSNLFEQVTALMKKYGSFEFTLNQARIEAEKAINAVSVLPDSCYKEALVKLALNSVNRIN